MYNNGHGSFNTNWDAYRIRLNVKAQCCRLLEEHNVNPLFLASVLGNLSVNFLLQYGTVADAHEAIRRLTDTVDAYVDACMEEM